MILKIRISAVCVATLVCGPISASDLNGTSDSGAPASTAVAEFNTRVAEDQLFIEGSRVLRCDLFFCVPGRETVVAPKGSEVGQKLPAVVWQYSGLLPANDYLKSIAIHSVSSDMQNRSWQDVQHNFYDGLLVEGAHDIDAKIAYAGAYAFAPRWSLVELVEIEDIEQKYPESVYFKIKYSEPLQPGMSIEKYRALSLQILQQPDAISLQDIQAVINDSDDIKTKSSERASLGGIGGADADIVASNEAKQLDSQASNSPELDSETEGLPDPAENASSIVVGGNSAFLSSINPLGGKSTSGSTPGGQDATLSKAGESVGNEVESVGNEDKSVGEEDVSASEGDESESSEDKADECAAEESESGSAGDESSSKEGECATDEDDSDQQEGEPDGEEEQSASAEDKSESKEKKSASAASQTANAAALTASAAGLNVGARAQSESKKDHLATEKVVTKESVGNAAIANTQSPIPSGIFGGESFKAFERDAESDSISEPAAPAVVSEAVESGLASIAADSSIPASRLQPAEIFKLPVGELFYSDKPDVSSDSQLDEAVAGSVEQEGAAVDLSVLNSVGETLVPKITESDVTEEEVMREVAQASGSDDDWIVQPDGSLVLESLEKLYTGVIR